MINYEFNKILSSLSITNDLKEEYLKIDSENQEKNLIIQKENAPYWFKREQNNDVISYEFIDTSLLEKRKQEDLPRDVCYFELIRNLNYAHRFFLVHRIKKDAIVEIMLSNDWIRIAISKKDKVESLLLRNIWFPSGKKEKLYERAVSSQDGMEIETIESLFPFQNQTISFIYKQTGNKSVSYSMHDAQRLSIDLWQDDKNLEFHQELKEILEDYISLKEYFEYNFRHTNFLLKKVMLSDSKKR